MKKLLIVILFSSCGNPKADIVKRQQALKNEIGDAMRAEDIYRTQHNFHGDSAGRLFNRVQELKFKYDSLEMELKKY